MVEKKPYMVEKKTYMVARRGTQACPLVVIKSPHLFFFNELTVSVGEVSWSLGLAPQGRHKGKTTGLSVGPV